MKYFCNTPLASWIKVFTSAILLLILVEKDSLFTWDALMVQKMLYAGLSALAPVIYNYLNPNDMRYGIKKLAEDITKEKIDNSSAIKGGTEGFVGPVPPPPPPPTVKH